MACGLFRSDDEGVSWTRIADIPEGRQPTSLLITESGTFFLGTNEGLFKAEMTSSVGAASTEAGEEISVRAVPNPVTGDAEIKFVLASSSHVRLDLFDPLGRLVFRIVEGDYDAGEHSISWPGMTEPAAGNYVLVIEAGGESSTRNVIVLPD